MTDPIPIAMTIPTFTSDRTWPCTGGCGATVAHPGVCPDCDRVELAAAHAARLRHARASIPARYRWAAIEAPEMAQRARPDAVATVRGLFGQRLPLGVALVGPSGAGKTSLACAMLRRVHDAATFESPARVVERARRAWYVGAPALLDAVRAWERNFSKGDPPELLAMARTASVLVLDNVDAGKQTDPIVQLVFDRHDRQRPTIVTTWMTRAEAANAYGDGWARRVYERVIDVSQPVRRLGAA
jgi:DNA replication protein DnaC